MSTYSQMETIGFSQSNHFRTSVRLKFSVSTVYPKFLVKINIVNMPHGNRFYNICLVLILGCCTAIEFFIS